MTLDGVALFTRAWIEMLLTYSTSIIKAVALFTRAWIEMCSDGLYTTLCTRRPLHEGVD